MNRTNTYGLSPLANASLLNGNFETVSPTNPSYPQHWGLYSNASNIFGVLYPQTGRLGGSSVGIVASVAMPTNYGLLLQSVTTDITKQYKLSGWLKTSNVTGTSTIGIDWKDQTGVWISGKEATRISGTNDWQYLELISSPPTNSTWATIILRLIGNGTVLFDDVSFGEYVCVPSECGFEVQ